jgi:hypothetical protein
MLLDNWDALAAGLATYVREFLPHPRRGALTVRLPAGAGQVVAVFGSDGYAADVRVKKEVAALRQRPREGAGKELGFGLSEDGHAWALLVLPAAMPCRSPGGDGAAARALTAFLDEAVWEAWRLACGLPRAESSGESVDSRPGSAPQGRALMAS